MSRLLIGFIPYIALSVVHVGALAVGADEVAGPTKLTLMPLLAFAVVWGLRSAVGSGASILLLAAIGLSWLGDGAATFFPWAPTVPMMLLCFGLAHVCYIVLFWRVLAVRRVPLWTHRLRALVDRDPRDPVVARRRPARAGRALRARAGRHGGRGRPLQPARRCGAASSSCSPTRCSPSASSCPRSCPTGRARSSC